MRLIIFDWEGTLVRDHESNFECLRATAKLLGWTLTPKLRVFSTPWHFLDSPVNGLSYTQSKQLRQAYQMAYHDHCTPSQSTLNVIQSLSQRSYLLAIATNLNRSDFEKELKQSGLESYFSASVTPTESKPKPAPDMLEYLLNHLSLPKEEAIYIGDAAEDISAAIAANIASVRVNVIEGLKPDPTYKIDNIEQLLQLNIFQKP